MDDGLCGEGVTGWSSLSVMDSLTFTFLKWPTRVPPSHFADSNHRAAHPPPTTTQHHPFASPSSPLPRSFQFACISMQNFFHFGPGFRFCEFSLTFHTIVCKILCVLLSPFPCESVCVRVWMCERVYLCAGIISILRALILIS